jgi:hypothetical protein
MKLRRKLPLLIKAQLVPENSRRRAWWWNRMFVQVGDRYFYPDKSAQDIADSLMGSSARSEEVLAEAQVLLASEEDRRETVEQRSTSLQAAVAIASGFGLAGAGLLLSTGDSVSTAWRVVIGASYVVTLVCLAGTGFRALRATVRVHSFEFADPEGPVERAALSDERARLNRAGELLYCYSRNQPLIDYKVTQMRAAGHWFMCALAGLVITAALACAALLDDTTAETTRTPTPTTAQPLPGQHGYPWMPTRP